MTLELTESELLYLEKIMTKTLKASRKNLQLTKDEEQKTILTKSISDKDKLLKKLRAEIKNNAIG